MNTPETYLSQVDEAFARSDFDKTPLDAMHLTNFGNVPAGEDVAPVQYSIHGNLDAENLLMVGNPYFTAHAKPHFQLRLAGYQKALGEGWAVLGVEGYKSQKDAFTRIERKELATGSFAPSAERCLRVVEYLPLSDDQKLFRAGYSLDGDVAVQMAYDMYRNPNRGIRPIEGLGSVEAARTATRGRIAVVKAMATSGNDLSQNILDSNVVALNEAWGVSDSTNMKRSTKEITKRVNSGLASYVLAALKTNYALLSGFATDATTRQLTELAEAGLPTMVGQYDRSSVSGIDFAELPQVDNLITLRQEGDHSSDDNIRKSAARILYMVNNLPKRS